MRLITLFLIASLIFGGSLAAQTKIDPSVQINWTKNVNSQIHGVTNGTNAQDAFTVNQSWLKTNKSDVPFIFASEYGAVGDDGIDDWQSIQDAINATPGTMTTDEGAVIMLPQGICTSSKPLKVWKAGVVLRGVGYPATRLEPTGDFVGTELINFSVNRSFYRANGVGLQNFQIRMNDIPADGVVIQGAYDCSEFSNLWVLEVNNSYQAMRFEPHPLAATPVTQGVTMSNVQLMHNSAASTSVILRMEKCQEVQLYGVKCLEGQLDIYNCMGLLLDGCSFTGPNTTAIKISNDATYYTGWITIIGPTFEGVGGIMDIDGTSTYYVRYVSLINPRYYSTIPMGSTLEYARFCDIDGGTLYNTLGPHTYYNTFRIRTGNASLVDDAGESNIIIGTGLNYLNLIKTARRAYSFLLLAGRIGG